MMYGCLFHSQTFDASHLATILKYTLVTPAIMQHYVKEYGQGNNPNLCDKRHPGVSCLAYMFPLVGTLLTMGLRLYIPVHLLPYIINFRRRILEASSWNEVLFEYLTKVSRSCAYCVGYLGSAWGLVCATNPLGSYSLTTRKLQYLLCGSVGAIAILFESPSRRRSIGVILSSYSLISIVSLLAKKVPFLQKEPNKIRLCLEMLVFASAVSYLSENMIWRNRFLRKIFYGF
jgi:hypothetical protein